MWNIASLAIERPLYPWLLAVLCLLAGLWGMDSVGRLEDPAFPIKNVLIVTSYDGASATEVEQEITDTIEAALQELPYIDKMTSKSVAGRSEIQVEMKEQYGSDDTPQIFDELRRRVTEAAGNLPPGAGVPLVEDDFGDVFGIMYAISADGYSPADIRDMVRLISTDLKQDPRVAKVQSAGAPFEAIYIEIDQTQLTRLGLPLDALFRSIGIENQVTPAGSIAFDGRRLRIAPSLAFDSVQAVADMQIGQAGSGQILRLADIATITRELVEIPPQLIRHNGRNVFTLGVSVIADENVVKVGTAVDARMAHLLRQLPLGVEIDTIYAQHKVVDEAISTFLVNLALSIGTVVLALCLFMGWRAGTVVGVVLLLTVLGTIGIMAYLGVELQRISLGALMISMGMLVDNAIVIAEGMITGTRRGLTPAVAAGQSVQRTQFALLGATIIGIVAFGPIGLSDDNSGHFLRSLFQVVAISLLLSWVLAITLVPLFGSYLLRAGPAVAEADLYSSWIFSPYRLLLQFGLRYSWFMAVLIVLITASCLYGFQYLKVGFFPNTNSPLFYVDYRLPEGTDILTTRDDVVELETLAQELPDIESVTSFVGRGATRFTTIMRPEQPNAAYAQLVLRVADVAQMDDLMAELDAKIRALKPDAELQVSRAEFSPGSSSKIEVRFSGPDIEVLRTLSEQAHHVYLQHQLVDRKTDWRQPQLQLEPRFNETGARLAGITRGDVAQALAYATLGVPVGLYRESNKLIPIIARAPAVERVAVGRLLDRTVYSPAQQRHIPMSQVVDSFELRPENATIFRRDRTRTITAQANPPPGHNPTATVLSLVDDIKAIELPPGYKRQWGGEFESNEEANDTLGVHIPKAFIIMFIITVLMFGHLRQPLVIWLTVPMTVCGVVVGLLVTDLSFTFPSFLGLLSLSGMLIKNCIVLVDEIDRRLAEGPQTVDTMIHACISRLRPVFLAAGTTIAGMSPLLSDAFFMEMAVCIMSGLAFATLLTLIAVPVFYRIALGRTIHTRDPALATTTQ